MNIVLLGVAFVVAAATALSAALVATLLPLLRRVALVHPNSRSSHRASTPQGGGIAVVAATLAVASGIVVAGISEQTPHPSSVWLVFAATAFVATVGAADDLWTIEVAPRLLLQAIAVGVVIAVLPPDVRLIPLMPWWLERLLLLVVGLWFVNLTNFMDGIDWMTIAEMVPITAALALFGVLGALPTDATAVALALCGALIGFAPFNRPVARIFLGDVGSLPIGLIVAWLLLLLAAEGHVAAAAILPLYYLADATLTLMWRIARGERFWQAHRTHFYQRATDRGFGVLEIVARVFAVNVVLVMLAVASVTWPDGMTDAAALAGAAVVVGWLLYSFARGKPWAAS